MDCRFWCKNRAAVPLERGGGNPMFDCAGLAAQGRAGSRSSSPKRSTAAACRTLGGGHPHHTTNNTTHAGSTFELHYAKSLPTTGKGCGERGTCEGLACLAVLVPLQLPLLSFSKRQTDTAELSIMRRRSTRRKIRCRCTLSVDLPPSQAVKHPKLKTKRFVGG